MRGPKSPTARSPPSAGPGKAIRYLSIAAVVIIVGTIAIYSTTQAVDSTPTTARDSSVYSRGDKKEEEGKEEGMNSKKRDAYYSSGQVRQYHRGGLLLNEYQKLQVDLRLVKDGVDGLRRQLHSEPQPPKADRFTIKTLSPRAITFPNGSLNGIKKGGSSNSAPNGGNVLVHDGKQDETIFVSIASFRDTECPNTVRDMYTRAFNPQRLFLGIIEQNALEDVGCIPLEYYEPDCGGYIAKYRGFCPTDNIRIRRVRPSEARGPTFGRWVAMLMYRDEKYFMMIDSHNRFLTNWDSKVIAIYALIPSKKGVLSHYPNSWLNTTNQQESEGSLMVMCYAHFLDLGYVRLGARVMPRSQRPRLQPYAAAGFVFADGALVREVPFDPYLDFVFDGEEILYSVRMWTHGWDMYSPTESVLFHYYLRQGAQRVWTVKGLKWNEVQLISQKRVQNMLGSTYPNTTIPLVPAQGQNPRVYKELDIYGLGKARSLEEYWRFARIEPVYRKTDYSFCDNIQSK